MEGSSVPARLTGVTEKLACVSNDLTEPLTKQCDRGKKNLTVDAVRLGPKIMLLRR